MTLPTQCAFKESLNQQFKVNAGPDGEVCFQLSSVSEIRDRGLFDSFTIEFSGPDTVILKQKVYEITHGELGTHAIFLVPIGTRDNKVIYQAVFSYKKP